jgi:RimJ/RimL family protein N-acetyltransferase
VLHTPRLTLRSWRDDDAPRLLDILGRREVMRWLGDGDPQPLRDLDEARAKIERFRERSATPPLGAWAIEVAATGVVAGSVLLLTLPHAERGEVEIGWWLHPDTWGHGYASEAAAAVLTHGFAHGLDEIHALTHTDNAASMAVCRRLGLRDLGVVERWYDGPSQLFRISSAEHADRVRTGPA